MPDELSPAVKALQQKLEEMLQQATDTKRTINMLLKMSGQQPLYTDIDNERSNTVRRDQFYGKGLATAAAEYLAMRKEASLPEEILKALETGGFDFDVMGWKESDRLRSLAISLAKNTGAAGKFHRLKNGTFGLRSWYDAEFLKRASSLEAQPQKRKPRSKLGNGRRARHMNKRAPISATKPADKAKPLAGPAEPKAATTKAATAS